MPKVDEKDFEDREARFRAAQQDFQNGVYTTCAAAARAHRVARVTLSNRIKGKHSDARTGQAARQKISGPAEAALVDWCIFHGMMGVPWTKETLLARAQEVAGLDIKITMSWCRRFLHRHRHKLKYKFAYELDPKRASGFNRPTVDAHFQMLKKLMEDYNIPIEHLYNMDEKGLQIGGGRSTSRRKHLFGLLQKAQYKLKHDNLELMTIIECICADGSAMKPTFVHQHGDVGFWWNNKEIGCCVATDSGWTSDDICEAWFFKVFLETAVGRRISDAPIVLLLDGHSSHISSRILDIAYQNRVFIVCLPPKTTHKLQPLDVGVFNLIQAAWKRLCEDSTVIGEPISKTAAITRYMEAREAGLRSSAVLDAWRRSGQHPLDPSIFSDEDYAPSMVSSTSTHLPPSFPIADPPVFENPPAPNPDGPLAGPIENVPLHSGTPDADPNLAMPGHGVAPPEATRGLNSAEAHTGPTLAAPTRKPVRDQCIGDWRGLPLKQQVAGYRTDVESMWEMTNNLWEQLESALAHAALLRSENEGLRRQNQARNKPKKTQDEASAASKLQKHGFLTNPETEAAFRAHMAELEAKRAADARKAAEKEARAREIEGRRSLMIVDPNYVFNGTLLSYKNANLEDLGTLAASLAVPVTGLKKTEIFNKITNHFETHPELKTLPRYANLFRAGRAPRRVADQAPVMIAGPALPEPAPAIPDGS